MFPKKIQNKTNGVTPRRWLLACNPKLADLIKDTLGDEDFITNMTTLRDLANYTSEDGFIKKFVDIKRENKKKL